MSLTRDWMCEDNAAEKAAGSQIRARRKVVGDLVITLLHEAPRRVGAAFERLKSRMTEEERAAIKGASSDDHLKQRPL